MKKVILLSCAVLLPLMAFSQNIKYPLTKVYKLEDREWKKFMKDFSQGKYEKELLALSASGMRKFYTSLGGYESLEHENTPSPKEMLSRVQRWDWLIEKCSDPVTYALRYKMEEAQLKPYSFNLTDTDGNHWKLEDLRNKIVFVNFFFAACRPCVAEIPLLNKLQERYKDKVLFLAITTMDKKQEAIKFKERFELKLPVVAADDIVENRSGATRCTNAMVGNRLGIVWKPTNVLIGEQGQLINLPPFLSEKTYSDYIEKIDKLLEKM